MAGPWNLNGPAVDFSPLGNLYAGFIGAQDHARKRLEEEQAGPLFEKMLAAYGQQQGAGAQPGSLSALAAQTGGMPGLPGNGAGAAMTPKGPPNEREKQAFDFFVSQGHSPAAAAGIVGNLVQESGLNPGAINRGDGADGSASIGVGQWNAGRAKALQEFAAQRGSSVNDLNTQLAFVQHELSGPESRVGQQLRGVNDPQAAAGIFAGYERPRGWREGGDPSQVDGWQNRSGTAARLMAAYGSNVPSNAAPGGNVQVAQADLPSPNAQDAAFYVPGSGPAQAPAAPAGLPAAAAATSGGMQPELRAALAAGLRNPQTRAAAMQLWQQVASPTSQFDFQVVGDQLYRTNKRTGAIEPVPGVTKPNTQVMEVNGRIVSVDKNTNKASDITPADLPSGSRPMTPAERQQFGLAADAAGFIDAKGVPHTLGPQTQVNIDQKGEGAFETEFGKKAADRWNGYIAGADKAQGQMADINNLRELGRRIGSQGSSAEFKATIGPYAESLGINIEGLSDIQAYKSVIERLAPNMRATGSGSTSDIEYKGFLRALPGLSDNPMAREAILNTFQATAQQEMQKGEIATRLANKEITRAEAEKQIRALPDPLTSFREWRKSNPDLYGAALNGKQTAAPRAGQPKQQSQYTEGQTATGPGGKKIVFRNGNWEPMQ